ncbi:hypothetical protein NPIL_693592, partial [Nephila pilipes]
LERVVHNDDDGRWLYGAGGGVGARRITRSRLGKTTAKDQFETSKISDYEKMK